MKRLVSLLLLCGMLFSAVACSGQPDTGDTDKTAGDESPAIDLEEAALTIATDSETKIFRYNESTVEADNAMQRIADVEQKLNCTIKLICPTDWTSQLEYYQSNIAVGMAPADIINHEYNNELATLAYADMLYPLTELKDIVDYEDSDKYGSTAVLECAMYKGVPYAVQPAYWPGYTQSQCFYIAFNRDIVADNSFTSPQEYYENKTWTWDNFEKTLTESVIDRGDSKIQGVQWHTRAAMRLALMSNGVKYVDYLDGQLQTDIYSQKAVNAIQWLQDLYANHADMLKTNDSSYWDLSVFMAQDCVFATVSALECIFGSLQYDCDFQFGIVPFPCGPDATYGQWAQWIEVLVGFAIPNCVDEPEYSAYLISELFEPYEEYGGKDGIADYYNQNYFMDPIDTEVFLNTNDFARYCYWPVGGYDIEMNGYKSLMTSSPAELLKRYGGTVEKAVEEYIKPNYENYIYGHMYTEN